MTRTHSDSNNSQYTVPDIIIDIESRSLQVRLECCFGSIREVELNSTFLELRMIIA